MIGYGKIQIAYENIFHVNSFGVVIRAKARQIGLLLRRVADLARPIASLLGLFQRKRITTVGEVTASGTVVLSAGPGDEYCLFFVLDLLPRRWRLRWDGDGWRQHQ